MPASPRMFNANAILPSRRGCAIPTRHGRPSPRFPTVRTSPATSTNADETSASRSTAAARPTAYSWPPPPRSISIPAFLRNTVPSRRETNAPETSGSKAATSSGAGTRPALKSQAFRRAPGVAIDRRDDARLAVARELHLDASRFVLDGPRERLGGRPSAPVHEPHDGPSTHEVEAGRVEGGAVAFAQSRHL